MVFSRRGVGKTHAALGINQKQMLYRSLNVKMEAIQGRMLTMIDQFIIEKVACCVPVATQRARNDGFSATDKRNSNATNNLKALSDAVFLRNSLRNNSATNDPKK